MIIYGTRTFTKQLGCTDMPRACGNCRESVKHVIIREWVWFTLFFIPLIPLWRRYVLVCPRCKDRTKVKKRDLNI